MDVSFIVVSYNTRDATLSCIQSIVDSVPAELSMEIVVVDNDSTDDTVDRISGAYPAVRIIRNAVNIGYGSAHNIGARTSNGQVIFLMNADFFLNNKSTVDTVKYLVDNPLTIVGFRQQFQSGQEQRSLGVCPGWYDLFLDLTATKSVAYRNAVSRDVAGHMRVKKGEVFLDGACLATSRHCFERIDGFDPEFFFYAEDADLCFRAQKSGVTQALWMGEPCTHYRGHSTKKNAGFGFKAKNYVKSYLYFCRKNRSRNEYWLVLALLPLKFLAYGLVFYVSARVGVGGVEKYQLQFAYLREFFLQQVKRW